MKSSEKINEINMEEIKKIPHTVGVYIFRGKTSFPLYVGKSLDLRSRVMSHIRNPNETKMINQSDKIEFIETAGEIGALLLEAQMIKELNPLFNMRLRRSKKIYSIRVKKTIYGVEPEIIDNQSVNLGITPNLYGLFTSKYATNRRLRTLAKKNTLCQTILNLEKPSRYGCFGLQINTCLGACIGKESRETHDSRFLKALSDSEVKMWPFSGAIDLIEKLGEWTQRHRIANWTYLGTWCSKTKKNKKFTFRNFDLDSYKILVKPILLKTVKVEVIKTQ